MDTKTIRTGTAIIGAVAATLLASSAQAALVISNKATANVTCNAGLCTATAADAVLNVTDLADLIAASPVTIQSGSAPDIVFNAPFSWTSSNGLTVTADAIVVNKAVTDSGTAALNLSTEPSFGPKGNVSFLSTSNELTIGGVTYQLVDSIASLASAVKNKEKYIALAHNYDASGDGVYSSAPVPELTARWVEGLGNSISNLTIRGNKNIGLFAKVHESYLQNIRLKNVKMDLEGQSTYDSNIGALLAYSDSSRVNGCSSSGKISATNAGSVGGLVGEGAFYSFENNYSAVSVSATQNRDYTAVGGLAGDLASYGKNLRATGSVQGGGYIGGLVGLSTGVIESSYATGAVSLSEPEQSSIVGGLVGFIGGPYSRKGGGALMNSYATGFITVGPGLAGGLVGYFRGDRYSVLQSSYSIGSITILTGNPTVGGLAGTLSLRKSKDAKYNYWDIDTSGIDEGTGQGNIPGITGLTDEQLKSSLPEGFDPAVWAEDPKINNGYPYLIANPPQK